MESAVPVKFGLIVSSSTMFEYMRLDIMVEPSERIQGIILLPKKKKKKKKIKKKK